MNRRVRLTKKDVQEIKRLLKNPIFSENLDCVALAFSTSERALMDIRAKRTWKRVKAARQAA